MGMLSGEKVDWVPRIPILMHFAAKNSNISYKEYAGDFRGLVKAKTSLVKQFGIDCLDIMSDPWRETTAFGAEIEYLENSVPKCVRPPLSNTKDLKRMAKPDLKKSARIANALSAVDSFREFGHQQYSITGWVEGPAAEACDLREVSNFLMDLMDDTAFAGELMDVCVEFAIEFAVEQISRGCDTIGIGDAIASQVSPAIYENLILHREKRIVDAIHQAGGKARLHICGNINHLIPHIAALRVDILDCDWQVDLTRARKIVGDQVALAGNLNPVEDVMNSNPTKIHERFKAIYEAIGNPYLVNAGCEIPLQTPAENLRAVCKPIQAQ